ncbi:hypothetical protein CPB84DRAFT_1763070 [Gymnopilus junonius]|uniref:Uncharacterized protein n=1 Tax=Gymnopilus junonius TaxID=109634 RepID=A0A9P5NYF2_GYMJU|nr:hypothetical protein CPB84DRAFT_1763070 [Gymnopilus junonius]
MMLYASQGLRNAARKGSSALIHGGHNGPGGNTSANPSTHWPGALRAYAPSTPFNFSFNLQSIRPRNPSHKLFSASKNALQRFFTHLTAPGLRLPTQLSEAYGIGARSLHQPLRGSGIQSGLSLSTRHALTNNALRRQAHTFLPQVPTFPARCGGVTQVGLGTARNFSSARPIFQNLAQNVPVAGRALYEIDWDIEMRKGQEKMRLGPRKSSKKFRKMKEMMKPTKKVSKQRDSALSEKENVFTEVAAGHEDIERYFPAPVVAPVTTYLLIPLAPTPTSHHPLNPVMSRREPTLVPPLSDLGSLHASHSTHALRLNALFTRLDQANVWACGNVHYSAYSQGDAYQRRGSKANANNSDQNQEGVCTILKVEFVGWTKAEVRGVIGESGSGWCMLEEVYQDEVPAEEEELSDFDSLSSGSSSANSGLGLEDDQLFDPAQSFIMPSVDLSSSSPEPGHSKSLLVSIPAEMERDPWADDHIYSSSSGSSSYSDLSDLIVDPPSSNGWFGVSHGFGQGASSSRRDESIDGDEIEPMEEFY